MRRWEICVLSAHLNHNSWDDKALPLNCLFLFSLRSLTCFLFPHRSDSIHQSTFSHFSSASYSPDTHFLTSIFFLSCLKIKPPTSWQLHWQPNKAAPEGTERQDSSDAFTQLSLVCRNSKFAKNPNAQRPSGTITCNYRHTHESTQMLTDIERHTHTEWPWHACLAEMKTFNKI